MAAIRYVIESGDCLASIAQQWGFYWETLWNSSANAVLKSRRKNPNILLEGDVVEIPEKQPRQESRKTEAKHRFRRKGVPVKLRLRLLLHGEPIGNKDYSLKVGGVCLKGKTDADGILEQKIPPSAKHGTLLLGPEKTELHLQIGSLSPLAELSGQQARLNNLDFYCGDEDGIAAPKMKSALKAFQETHGLKPTGEMDDETRNKIKDLYGC